MPPKTPEASTDEIVHEHNWEYSVGILAWVCKVEGCNETKGDT